MYRILRNAFLTSRTGPAATRTVALESEDEGQVVAVSRETPESILLEHADQRRGQAALDELPVLFRGVLLLCEVEEMSYQEIAHTLSIPIGTVMSRLYRTRKALRAALERGRAGKRSMPEGTWQPKLDQYLDSASATSALAHKSRQGIDRGRDSCNRQQAH